MKKSRAYSEHYQCPVASQYSCRELLLLRIVQTETTEQDVGAVGEGIPELCDVLSDLVVVFTEL